MGPHLKVLLRQWEDGLKDSQSLEEEEEQEEELVAVKQEQFDDVEVQPSPPPKRVCRYCHREFKCGRALGGHIKIHYRKKFTHKKRRRSTDPSLELPPRLTRSSYKKLKAESEIIDLAKFLTAGWKVHKKRGSNQLKPFSYPTQTPIKEVEYSDFSHTHQITKIRDHEYVCLTCDMFFPTLDDARCHLYESVAAPDDSDDEEVYEVGEIFAEVSSEEEEEDDDDDDDDEEVDDFAEVYENSGWMNQAVFTPKSARMLDFDLNDMPPEENEA